MAPVTMLVIGAGQRGRVYSQYAVEFPELARVVAVADPLPNAREHLVKHCNIPKENVYNGWKEAAEQDKMADIAVIATHDRMHCEPAVAFAAKGYHILLEKPMAVSEAECRLIVKAILDAKVMFCVGHVLRYSAFARALKGHLDSGLIGDIINVQHLEPVGWYHFAHSYVRGNWHKESEASFSLMAKSCHDIDYIRYLVGKKCKKISSFGNLTHFKSENKPSGAGSRCLDCDVEKTCPYSAKKMYIEPLERGEEPSSFTTVVSFASGNQAAPDVENITEALKTLPYGKCVYDCDNDVCDHQVVNIEFEGGQTASFSMIAFTEEMCERKTVIFGSKGQITATMGDGVIRHFDFASQKTTLYGPDEKWMAPAGSKMVGHNGSDYGLMKTFIDAVSRNDPTPILSGTAETLESHLMVFAAEHARHTDTVVDVPAYIAKEMS